MRSFEIIVTRRIAVFFHCVVCCLSCVCVRKQYVFVSCMVASVVCTVCRFCCCYRSVAPTIPSVLCFLFTCLLLCRFKDQFIWLIIYYNVVPTVVSNFSSLSFNSLSILLNFLLHFNDLSDEILFIFLSFTSIYTPFDKQCSTHWLMIILSVKFSKFEITAY